MKKHLLFILPAVFFFSFKKELKAQWMADTMRYPTGKIYWTSNNNAEFYNCLIYVYYYENGQRMKKEIVDTTKKDRFIEHFWLSDGTQTVEDGTGRLIEVGSDSSIYSVSLGKFNGLAQKYKLSYRTQNRPPVWKLYAEGNYKNGFKNGSWNFLDTSGFKTATVNYVSDTVRGSCVLYYPGTNKIKTSGDLLNCLQEGEWKSYDENENLVSRAHYKNGIRTGEYTEYYAGGKIKLKGQYKQKDKTLRTAIENPYSPGTFRLKKRKFTVAYKTGFWLYCDENGALLKKKKYRNNFEPPANYEPSVYRHKKYYDLDLRIVSGIPDCNYY